MISLPSLFLSRPPTIISTLTVGTVAQYSVTASVKGPAALNLSHQASASSHAYIILEHRKHFLSRFNLLSAHGL